MEKKSRKSMIIGISVLLLVTLTLLGLTYAYYRTRIVGNPNEESISVTSKKLEVKYSDDNAVLEATQIVPGNSFSKTFTVENTGDEKVSFSIKLDKVENNFIRNDWTYKLYSGSEANSANLITSGAISNASVQIVDPSVEIEAGDEPIVQTYTMVIEYAKLDEVDQSDDMGKSLSLRINIGDELELLANSDEIKVGDYVYYTYLNTGENERIYTTPTVASGKSVYENTQTFNSGTSGNVNLNRWRVLSVNNGEVELIPDIPQEKTENDARLILYGIKGYLNGNTVLNEMCNTLYSGEYGTARSMTLDDVKSLLNYSASPTYVDSSGNNQNVAAGTTIGEIENQYGQITNRITPDGRELGSYEINYYADLYTLDFVDANSIQQKIIGDPLIVNKNDGNPYWLASGTPVLSLKENIVKYRQYFVNGGFNKAKQNYVVVASRHLYNSQGEEQIDVLDLYFNVRPVVKLNGNLLVEKDVDNNTWVLSME